MLGVVTHYDPLTNRNVSRVLVACRDCGWRTTRPRSVFFKAQSPRCIKCGGMLDAIGIATDGKKPKAKKKAKRKRRTRPSQPVREHSAKLHKGARRRQRSAKRAYPEQPLRSPVVPGDEPKGMA